MGNTIEARQPRLDALYKEIFPQKAVPARKTTQAQPVNLDDAALLAKARATKNGADFDRLWNGDISGYDSHSEADLALCGALAKVTGGNQVRIDGLFRQSGLCRPKWIDRADYRERTLARAIEGTSIYSPPSPSGNGPGPEEVTGRFPQTDSGNAELFASMHGNAVRFDWRRQRWVRWAKHFWEPDDTGLVLRLAKASARHRYTLGVEIEDLEARKSESKWAITSESKAKLEAALALARAEPGIGVSGAEWDRGPMLLATPSGVVDLSTGKLRAGRQDDYLMLHTDTSFNPDAQCPRWWRFLQEIFNGREEIIDFIHRAIGYSITGVTSQQCWFLAYGKGANGKSTFLSVLAHVLGSYAQTLPFDTLSTSERPAIPNDLAALVGARFVTTIESGEARRLNEARIKALAGEDTIRARFLHAEFFDFKPALKLWLATNHKPIVRDQSHGFWRKVRLIPFEQEFQVNDKLTAELLAEAEGILAWAVEGALAWQKERLEPPDDVLIATDQYRQDEDVLAAFYDDRCVLGRKYEVRAQRLFETYRTWAEANRLTTRETLSNTLFGRIVSEKFVKKHRRTGAVYLGIGLKAENPGSCDGCDGLEENSQVSSDSIFSRVEHGNTHKTRHTSTKDPSQPVTEQPDIDSPAPWEEED